MSHFDKHCAALLRACGYVEHRYPEEWEDIGGPENGPKLSGHPAFNSWELYDLTTNALHVIVVERGEVTAHETVPAGYGDGWEAHF